MRIVVLIFVLFCAFMQAYYLHMGELVLSAIYNVGTLVLGAIQACTVDRR